jgi:vancomycin permeability regulator SanA
MSESEKNYIQNTPLSKNRRLVHIVLVSLVVLLLLVASIVIVCSLVISSMNKYVLTPTSSVTAPVGIVFGAGITPEGRPYKELQARLDDAADSLERGQISKLILSGDNRFLNYNEPEAMKLYLTDTRGIDEKSLQVDYAGRSTYETCERANKIFSVNKAILFSANSHLPRAIYTCRSFGIESYGIGNTLEASNANRREPLARVKALFNIYVYGEKTILGEKIDLGLNQEVENQEQIQ